MSARIFDRAFGELLLSALVLAACEPELDSLPVCDPQNPDPAVISPIVPLVGQSTTDQGGIADAYYCKLRTTHAFYGLFVVRINKAAIHPTSIAPSHELWILDELENGQPATSAGPFAPKRVDALGMDYNAVMALNGFIFDLQFQPQTSVFASAMRVANLDPATYNNKLLWTGPRGQGTSYVVAFPASTEGPAHTWNPITTQLEQPGAPALAPGTYDAYYSAWPLYYPADNPPLTRKPASGNGTQPVVGFSADQVVILLPDRFGFFTSDELQQAVLQPLRVVAAVYNDGGPSSQLYGAQLRDLTSLSTLELPPDNTDTNFVTSMARTASTNVSYAFGLVYLNNNVVSNYDFEVPDITQPSPSCGRGAAQQTCQQTSCQNYSFTANNNCGQSWRGLAFYRRTGRGPTYRPSPTQIAGIRRRALSLAPTAPENSLSQTVTVPAGSYCELHLWHGYNPLPLWSCPDGRSTLVVTIGNGNPIPPMTFTSSNNSSMDEGWMRFKTPGEVGEGNVSLEVNLGSASSQAPCEAVIDDVSIRCTRP